MTAFTQEQLEGHAQVLAERVFETETRYPHFKLLLKDVRRFAETLPEGVTVVSMERTLLYGGYSLIAPFFQRQNFISIDCSPQSADQRGAYNAKMLDDPRALKVKHDYRSSLLETGLDDSSADLILVPNLVHHVGDQDALFAELARVVKPGGAAYIFEPTVRELHQIPDDYLRYTPFGVMREFRQVGLEPEAPSLEGGPFQAVAYCWIQALQYFPDDQRPAMEEWFYTEQFPKLMQWDETLTENQVKKNSAFPLGFSVLARKPAG